MAQTLQTGDLNPGAPNLTPPSEPSPGCLASFFGFFAGFVLPCVSPAFYSNAIRRKAVVAVLFFFVFASTVTCLQTANLAWSLAKGVADVPANLERNKFPDIYISGGIAQVSGPQPYVLSNENRQLMAIDTSGVYTDIDTRKYDLGFLLTRTKLILLRNGRYQQVPLFDLQDSIGVDPIELNRGSIPGILAGGSVALVVIVAICLWLWNTVVQLAYLMLLAGVLWGITALLRPGATFGPVFVTGLYALVPATYAQFLLSQARFDFCGLFTFLLLVAWATALHTATSAPNTAHGADTFLNYLRAPRPVRAWRALIGLPLLLDLAGVAVFSWKIPDFSLALALATFGILVEIGFRGWQRRHARQAAA